MAKQKPAQSDGTSTPKAPRPLPTGKVGLRKDPRAFSLDLVFKRPEFRRIVGLDLGTNCGFAFVDIIPGQPITKAVIVGGIWDLSLGPYDSGPLRHIRLKHFLSVTEPDLIMYEEVKYTPPTRAADGKPLTVHAVVARVASAAELLGGLKTTATTWAEERGIPAQGVSIQHIKQFATGKGNASKVDMIKAANEKFGLSLEIEDYENHGTDNIADALFVCNMGMEQYSEGLT